MDIRTAYELDSLLQRIRDESQTPGVRLEAHIDQHGDLFIDALSVPRLSQRQGIGSRMLSSLLAWADGRNLQVNRSPGAGTGGHRDTGSARAFLQAPRCEPEWHGWVRRCRSCRAHVGATGEAPG